MNPGLQEIQIHESRPGREQSGSQGFMRNPVTSPSATLSNRGIRLLAPRARAGGNSITVISCDFRTITRFLIAVSAANLNIARPWYQIHHIHRGRLFGRSGSALQRF